MTQLHRQVVENNDTFDVPIRVCGDPHRICYNTRVEFTVPTGISLTGPYETETSNVIDVPKGYFNVSELMWYLGNLDPAVCIETNFIFRVDDVSEADDLDNRFFMTAVLTTSCIEEDSSDNTLHIVVSVVPECNDADLSIGNNNFHSTGHGASLSIG